MSAKITLIIAVAVCFVGSATFVHAAAPKKKSDKNAAVVMEKKKEEKDKSTLLAKKDDDKKKEEEKSFDASGMQLALMQYQWKPNSYLPTGAAHSHAMRHCRRGHLA